MSYLYFKALHIIFVVTWFSGLFYIVRLFIYFSEAELLPEPSKFILQQQYRLMQQRLWYGITWPSAVITSVWGGLLAWQYHTIPDWLWVKLSLVVLLYAYHFLCHHIFLNQQGGISKYSSYQLRVWNEIATIFLVGIIFVVVLKNVLSMLWGISGLIVFTAFLISAIRLYKKVRDRT